MCVGIGISIFGSRTTIFLSLTESTVSQISFGGRGMKLLCFFDDADQRFDSFYFFLSFEMVSAASLELFFLLEEQMIPVSVLSLQQLVILL